MSQRRKQNPNLFAASRFRRERPQRRTATGAVTLIGGTVLLALVGWLTFYATTLQTGNAQLKTLTDQTEQQARAGQGRRLLDQVAQQQMPAVPPAQAPTRSTETASVVAQPAAEPAQPAIGMLAALREKLRIKPPSANTTAPPLPRAVLDPAPPSATVTASTPAAPPPAPAATVDAARDADAAKRLFDRIGETRTAALPPPPARAAAPAIANDPPSGMAAWARFLLSEHDTGLVPLKPPVAAALPAAVRPDEVPAAAQPADKTVALPPPPPLQPPTPNDMKRRHATAAECTAIIEQAQLGEMTSEHRTFLQERCR